VPRVVERVREAVVATLLVGVDVAVLVAVAQVAVAVM